MRLLSEMTSDRDRLALCEGMRSKLAKELTNVVGEKEGLEKMLSKLAEALLKVVGEKEMLEKMLADAIEEKGRMGFGFRASKVELRTALGERDILIGLLAEIVTDLRDFLDNSTRSSRWRKIQKIVDTKEEGLRDLEKMLQRNDPAMLLGKVQHILHNGPLANAILKKKKSRGPHSP
mmetsp:Transcript_7398/g.12713  ORF Transcript_7398/g.12713 Transcript_7398/m.12713 type:complete len:177 (+) Transcript_7398:107-637(+)